jgi:hypothetical protein
MLRGGHRKLISFLTSKLKLIFKKNIDLGLGDDVLGVKFIALVLFMIVSLWTSAEEAVYSKPTRADYPRDVFFGDTHLHSRLSADAYSLGNMNLTQGDAYLFAQGQAMTAHNGMQVQLRRPLDFLVVSDHAEYLGGFYRYNVNDPAVINTDAANTWKEALKAGNPNALIAAFSASMQDPENNPAFPESVRREIWQDVAETADQYNKPGQFTALIGYEWTVAVRGNNLHRVVVYRDGADKVAQLPPFSGQDSLDPRDLWAALGRYEKKTGGEVMAIGHNGNISNGMMFPNETIDGKPLTRKYAETRSRWEPIYEVTQVKGDGEAHPKLSPTDEFADFENWDKDNISQTAKKEDWMLKHEYARSALKLGLGFEESLGVNPFKIGLIGSTDGHNSLSTPEENNFFGKFPASEPHPNRLKNRMANNVMWQNTLIVASGYAAVWAKENTRASLFDAMKRKEVYATTGSRIMVRFFGGWDFDDDLVDAPDYLDVAYSTGVPMGGDLTAAPEGQSPHFLVLAAKDPDGANLDRIQIVKGWRDPKGMLHEKVYDVAWSGDREINPVTGKLPAVGNTVDVQAASYKNSIGASQLSTTWTDPDFSERDGAFYYVRVLEIPIPRWTTYDAAFFDLPRPKNVPETIQDRAYTSPIWYTP